jgi:phosphatidate cytidylyltransferase|tara:strand:- start:100 stop:750 length:651 start_codon:yes stop_codon:yes gene_type:complete
MKNEILKRIISSVILIPLSLFIIIKGSFYFIFFISICFLIASYEWSIIAKKKKYLLPGFLFLLFSFFSFYQLRNLGYSYELILFVLIICVFTDLGGYVFGKIFKGPKLTKFSPNKTYAGVVGSYLFSVIALYYIGQKFLFTSFLLNHFVICIYISSISQLGDIIISYFKRVAKMKDSGRIIPGHGGVLDRIDGMIFSFPALYLTLLNDHFLNYLEI